MSEILDAMNRNSHPEIIVTDMDTSINDILINDNSVVTNGNGREEGLQGNSSDILTETFHDNDILPNTDISTECLHDSLSLKETSDVILKPFDEEIGDCKPDIRQTTSACPGINVTNTEDMAENLTENLAEILIEKDPKSTEQLDEEISALRLAADLVRLHPYGTFINEGQHGSLVAHWLSVLGDHAWFTFRWGIHANLEILAISCVLTIAYICPLSFLSYDLMFAIVP